MDIGEARPVLIDALRLARERVTGDSSADKLSRELAIGNTIERLKAGLPTPQPTGTELRALLGRQDDRDVQDALSAWPG